MKRRFKIVCRGSRLSLAQAGIFEKRLRELDAELEVELVVKETRGDLIQDVPLQDIQGVDFFTRDIQDHLMSGQADFAVHSLKDVSGENFFLDNHHAIIEREDPRDAVIFNKDIIEILEAGMEVRIGTSSPRRVNMATGFLLKALPWFKGQPPKVAATSIRGNVDTRLKKLDASEFDGIILAVAGLNRLLRDDTSRDEIRKLLIGKYLMILPMLHCPPAPGQGAIVAETVPGNTEAVEALNALSDLSLTRVLHQERSIAHQYGAGCHQEFGVVYVDAGEKPFIFAAGRDRDGRNFSERFATDFAVKDLPQSAQRYTEFRREVVANSSPVVDKNPGTRNQEPEIRNVQNSIHLIHPGDNLKISKGNIWVSETDSWFALSREGIWVEGSVEGMGLRYIMNTWSGPLVSTFIKTSKDD